MAKIIINFTPTGMIPMKKDTPHIPVSIPEIIEDVKKAWETGITMTHLHVRDEVTQEPCYQKETYAKIIGGIREFAPELIIIASTSGRIFHEYEERSDVLKLSGELKPDMASLTLSSVNFNNQASLNEPSMISGLAKEMLERGIKPELEAFDNGMINYAKYLITKNILKPPHYFNLILGNIACAQANMLHAGLLINDLPEHSVFSMGGVGDFQLQTNSLAIAMGHGVRVGLEDNIWYDRGRSKLATNLDLVNRVQSLVKINQDEVMTSGELRNYLGLKKGYGEYGVRT